MVLNTHEEPMHTLHLQKETEIHASVDVVWESLLAELGPEGTMPDGKPFAKVLEAWPGGRWYRDLGNNSGHFWGHVQVIKPPPFEKPLVEICGPMFMSYPAVNFVQYRVTGQGAGKPTKLTLVHRAFGMIPTEHREGVHMGWQHMLNRTKEIAERRR